MLGLCNFVLEYVRQLLLPIYLAFTFIISLKFSVINSGMNRNETKSIAEVTENGYFHSVPDLAQWFYNFFAA